MEGDMAINPEDLNNLSPEQVLRLLDASWPWPMSAVQSWFESLWNHILSWIHQAVDWIYNRVKPAIDAVWSWIMSARDYILARLGTAISTVWNWIQSAASSVVAGVKGMFSSVWSWVQTGVQWLWTNIQTLPTKIWSWITTGLNTLWQNILSFLQGLWRSIQDIAEKVGEKVKEINKWFSDEFIDPFLDWLLKLPKAVFDTLIDYMVKILDAVGGWFMHESPGFMSIFRWLWDHIIHFWGEPPTEGEGFYFRPIYWLKRAFTEGTAENKDLHRILMVVMAALGAGLVYVYGEVIIGCFTSLGAKITASGGAIGGWFVSTVSKMGGWIAAQGMSFFGSLLILILGATGKLEPVVDKFVTPAIMKIVDWFESMGPVAPQSAAGMSQGITKLATMTISGLAAMTIGGELLHPLKQVGLGNISAIIYDLINYRTLTAAFMGVLAYVYIKQPLTYYYQKVARPVLPDERQLTRMAGEYAITRGKFEETMRWHGYPDEWITALYELADRPLTPFLFRYLGEAQLLDDELIDRELKNAGYNELTIPYLKLWLKRVSLFEIKAIMTSAAISRFKEGLDDENTLQSNLLVLGVDPKVMPQYLFGANLAYVTDYQTDLIAYWKDAYHRRAIEEPELRRGLASAGLLPERVDLVVERESIKRLKPAVTEAPEVSAVKIDTIRRKRRKNLIDRGEELNQLMEIGVSAADAEAFADNDDIRIATKAPES